MALVLGAALKGGYEERLAASALGLNLLFTVIVRDNRILGVHWAELANDAMLLVVFIGLSLRTVRYSVLAATTFQLMMVLTHLAAWADPKIELWSYLTGIIIWTYGVMISLAVGIWGCWRDEQRAMARAANKTNRTFSVT